MESDQNDDDESILALPKRVRFYHAKIDGKSLKSGESYRVLKNVIIIMIMPYEDGATTLFLYTKGTKGNPSVELQQLLHYMEHTQDSYATNENRKKFNEW